MNVLVTGATGLLGRYLIANKKPDCNITGVYFGSYNIAGSKDTEYISLDIQHKNFLKNIFQKRKIDVVVHAGGIANVDFCETQYEIAYLSNVVGTQNIIDLCKEHGSKMVYISSNAVFDGKSAPYKESDPTGPINKYGQMKLECEKLVKAELSDYLIVRPILMYGWNDPHERKNLVTFLMEKLSLKKEVEMVTDVSENPVFAGFTADAIWSLIYKNLKGIYHIAGKDTVSRYEYALTIADAMHFSKGLIKPVDSGFFHQMVRRPANTSYDTAKLEKDTGMKTLGIKEGLALMTSDNRLKER